MCRKGEKTNHHHVEWCGRIECGCTERWWHRKYTSTFLIGFYVHFWRHLFLIDKRKKLWTNLFVVFLFYWCDFLLHETRVIAWNESLSLSWNGSRWIKKLTENSISGNGLWFWMAPNALFSMNNTRFMSLCGFESVQLVFLDLKHTMNMQCHSSSFQYPNYGQKLYSI